LSKETYIALGKAAAIVYKLGLHDTLRDLNFLCENLDFSQENLRFSL